MAKALHRLPDRAPPSKVTSKLKLDGLENITDLVGEWLEPGSQKRLSVIEGGT
jgi:predicted glycosyltransferase